MWLKPSLALVFLCLFQAPAFHSEARLVAVHVTVRNSHGELVTNLGRDAFTVYENGKRQTVSIFRRDDIPVSVGLLIDNSGSMRSVRSAVEEAALTFADASNRDDEL
ncbi:MAG TPA: VWA domain-containing protein, partial [Vicinamibacterales bacterium]